MKTSILLFAVMGLVVGCLVGGCTHNVQRSPALVKDKEVAPAVEQKSFLTQAGETTVEVVTAPVRLITPAKKPKKEPQVWEPTEMTFMGPEDQASEGAETATTQPAETQPAK